MFSSALLVLSGAASLASAHFSIEYPSWRADALNNDNYSEYTYPCAGVPVGTWNRTDWSLDGGSLNLDLHHPWTYIFVNLGLGDNVTNFNYSLTPSFWNETGTGNLCIPEIALPAELTPVDGQSASIQVVTLGESGSALYSCADITFRANVSAFGGSNCTTSDTVSYSVVNEQVNGTTTTVGSDSSSTSGSASSSSASSSSTSSSSSAGALSGTTSTGLLVSVAALAVAFAAGLTL